MGAQPVSVQLRDPRQALLIGRSFRTVRAYGSPRQFPTLPRTVASTLDAPTEIVSLLYAPDISPTTANMPRYQPRPGTSRAAS